MLTAISLTKTVTLLATPSAPKPSAPKPSAPKPSAPVSGGGEDG
jgi:hypothetical protein